MLRPVVRVLRSIWRASGSAEGERAIPEETAVAITYNTASYAVMMATPQDLEDFAIGFSLTEGVIPSVDAIDTIDIVEEEMGVELRIWLKAPEAAEFLGRRRKMAGPTGCGLCGVESLVEAMRPPPRVGEGRVFTRDQIMTAVDSLLPLAGCSTARPAPCTPPASGSRSAGWSRSERMSGAITRSTSSPAHWLAKVQTRDPGSWS